MEIKSSKLYIDYNKKRSELKRVNHNIDKLAIQYVEASFSSNYKGDSKDVISSRLNSLYEKKAILSDQIDLNKKMRRTGNTPEAIKYRNDNKRFGHGTMFGVATVGGFMLAAAKSSVPGIVGTASLMVLTGSFLTVQGEEPKQVFKVQSQPSGMMIIESKKTKLIKPLEMQDEVRRNIALKTAMLKYSKDGVTLPYEAGDHLVKMMSNDTYYKQQLLTKITPVNHQLSLANQK